MGDFLQERIFRPLGMSATQIISEADIVPNRASGYELLKGEIKNQKWVSATLNTTAGWCVVYERGGFGEMGCRTVRGRRLLKQASFEQMWTPVKLKDGKTYPYGFGWF